MLVNYKVQQPRAQPFLRAGWVPTDAASTRMTHLSQRPVFYTLSLDNNFLSGKVWYYTKSSFFVLSDINCFDKLVISRECSHSRVWNLSAVYFGIFWSVTADRGFSQPRRRTRLLSLLLCCCAGGETAVLWLPSITGFLSSPVLPTRASRVLQPQTPSATFRKQALKG